jgi:hypothetical protein
VHYYTVKVEIESNSGEFLVLETQRTFAADDDVMLFASGFADGFAMAHDGAVLDKQIKRVS